MKYPSPLTTYAAVSRQLTKANPGASPSPAQSEYDSYFSYLTDALYQSGVWISQQTYRSFVPERYTETVYFADWVKTSAYRHRCIILLDDILTLHSVTRDGVALTAGTDYRIAVTGRPTRRIQFNRTSSLTVNLSDFGAGIVIDATYCYHDMPNAAYTQIDASVTLANSTTTSIAVSSGAAYEVFQFVRCENELMLITAINTNTLTVRRGMNGTTAAAHTAQPLERFNIQNDIQLAATRIAANLYERRTNVGNVIEIVDNSVTLDALPTEATSIINRYRYHYSEVR